MTYETVILVFGGWIVSTAIAVFLVIYTASRMVSIYYRGGDELQERQEDYRMAHCHRVRLKNGRFVCADNTEEL